MLDKGPIVSIGRYGVEITRSRRNRLDCWDRVEVAARLRTLLSGSQSSLQLSQDPGCEELPDLSRCRTTIAEPRPEGLRYLTLDLAAKFHRKLAPFQSGDQKPERYDAYFLRSAPSARPTNAAIASVWIGLSRADAIT